MQWISKHAPIYVWEGDTWYNETNKKVYEVDLKNACWRCNDSVEHFTKKTKVIHDKA